MVVRGYWVMGLVLTGCAAPSEAPEPTSPVRLAKSRTEDLGSDPTPTHHCFADIDGDSFEDLITTQIRSRVPHVRVWHGGEPPPDAPRLTSWDSTVVSDIHGVTCVGDLDGNGARELVLLTETPTREVQTHIVWGDSDGAITLGGLTGRTDPVRLTTRRVVDAGDVNRDGYDDLWVMNSDTEVSLHYGSASGLGAVPAAKVRPAAEFEWPAELGLYDMHTADLDGDGISELYLTGAWFDPVGTGKDEEVKEEGYSMYAYRLEEGCWTGGPYWSHRARQGADFFGDGDFPTYYTVYDRADVELVSTDLACDGRDGLLLKESVDDGEYGDDRWIVCVESGCTELPEPAGHRTVGNPAAGDLDGDGLGEWVIDYLDGTAWRTYLHEGGGLAELDGMDPGRRLAGDWLGTGRDVVVSIRGIGDREEVFAWFDDDELADWESPGGCTGDETPAPAAVIPPPEELDCDGDGYPLSEDCIDWDAEISPGAEELANDNQDSDCDGLELCPADADADGWGSATALVPSPTWSCDAQGMASNAEDCDDGDAQVNPSAEERPADEADGDCDGWELCYVDLDGDGATSGETRRGFPWDCSEDGLTSSATLDCDDGDASRSPWVEEIVGNEVDEDCDRTEICYQDLDGDGFRTELTVVSWDARCLAVAGEAPASAPAGDCDDEDPQAYPGRKRPNPDRPEADLNCDGEPDIPPSEPPPPVEASGCDGCSTGGSGSGTWFAVLLGLAALSRRRLRGG